jgi:hypothetical protein
LDDVAALVYGYPKSTLRVRVLNSDVPPQPLLGAKVDLLNSAAPVNGSSIAEGGSVYGDVHNQDVWFGNGIYSRTYVDATPFDDTNSAGETTDINPIHKNLGVRVTAGSLTPVTQYHTVAPGENVVTVTIDATGTDFAGPTVAVTSHTSGRAVDTADITLSGTATDSERGGNGISQVKVNGEVADNGTAVDGGVARWSKRIALNEGVNIITITAYDNRTDEKNSSSLRLSITYDATPPTVSSVFPENGATNVAINQNFGVTFSEVLKPESINTSTFLVDNGVTGIVTYDVGTRRAVFKMSAPLAYNTTYTATLTTGIQDAVGRPMAENFSWSITTGAPTSSVPGDDGGGGGGGGGCFVGAAASR